MTEMELKLTGGRIVSAALKDGVLKIMVEETKEDIKVKGNAKVLETEVVHEDMTYDQFILVPASKLSFTDKFMVRHTPKSDEEKAFKELLTEVIKSGVSDFYRPKLDPSLDKQGKICYQAGLKPAVGKSYNWWEKNAKKFCPDRKSRLGTKSEYVAFLGVLIKKLVESGWGVDLAWYAVCNSSGYLGHYYNSIDALHNFEPTGSREICGFCDLANAFKILTDDKENSGFWVAAGYYYSFGRDYPLAGLYRSSSRDDGSDYGVGWLVLEK